MKKAMVAVVFIAAAYGAIIGFVLIPMFGVPEGMEWFRVAFPSAAFVMVVLGGGAWVLEHWENGREK